MIQDMLNSNEYSIQIFMNIVQKASINKQTDKY